jgi:hypothetical protein
MNSSLLSRQSLAASTLAGLLMLGSATKLITLSKIWQANGRRLQNHFRAF